MKINYLEFGKKGRPIVFLHGWQTDCRSFMPLVGYLKDYRLFLVDLPGFGKSQLLPDSFSSLDYADEIVNWIKSKKLNKVILIGHSFGGKIASIIASQNPKLIQNLVLFANSGIPHPKKYYKYTHLIPGFLRNLFRPFLAGGDYKQAGKLLPVFKTIVKEDLRPVFAEIKTPTLIIWGKNDEELPAEDGKKINSLIKKSRLMIVDGGHFPFVDEPEKMAKLITVFCPPEKITE